MRKNDNGNNLLVYDTRGVLDTCPEAPDSLEYLEMHKLGMRVQKRDKKGQDLVPS